VTDPAGGVSYAAYEPVYNMPTSLTDPLGRTAWLGRNIVLKGDVPLGN
jgi:hypothetical protein